MARKYDEGRDLCLPTDANEYLLQRMRQMKSIPKIAIFVDSEHFDQRRYCYWIDHAERRGWPFTLIAIPDLRRAVVERQERALPRLDGYDVIILNWDVANGDLAWLADDTLEFFQNRGRDEIRRWARNGSRVVIEIQSAAGYPLQELYDAILGEGEVRLSPQGQIKSFLDKEIILVENRRRRGHPILRDAGGVMGAIFSKYKPFHHVVFPGFDKSEESTYAINRRALSFGNFVDWSREWFPILLRSGPDVYGRERMPVALAKRMGSAGGEIIATTMRIANSHNDTLIDAFCTPRASSSEQIERFYLTSEIERDARRALEILALWAVGVFGFVPLLNFVGRKTDEVLQQVVSEAFSPKSPFYVYAINFRLSDATVAAVVLSLIAISQRLWRRRQST